MCIIGQDETLIELTLKQKIKTKRYYKSVDIGGCVDHSGRVSLNLKAIINHHMIVTFLKVSGCTIVLTNFKCS